MESISIVVDKRAKWRNLKQRLGLKAMGCCGAAWSPRARISTISILDEDEDEEATAAQISRNSRGNTINNNQLRNQTENNRENSSTPLLAERQQQQGSLTVTGMGMGMNLAMALAAERNLRGPGPTNHQVKTLMRLIEETDGVDWKKRNVVNNNNNGNINVVVDGGCEWMCCVCMERKKGAAFIPCGHAFCRVCCREVWVNRGSCPVCNRSILDILDIF